MTSEELNQRLLKEGLSGELEELMKHSRKCIRLYQQVEEQDDIPLGSTKIGGQPDLPDGIEWPRQTKEAITTERRFLFLKTEKRVQHTQSLSFIAQINLAQITEFDSDKKLPGAGMLYFFYCQDQMSWGFQQSDKSGFRVIYHDGDLPQLRRTCFPEDINEDIRFRPCSIRAREEISLPPYYHEVYDQMGDAAADKIMDFSPELTINKLLGYPEVVQNAMELECELVTNGLYCGDPSGYDDPRARILEPGANNWRLLLQIDSSKDSEMMWGDCGKLYFWIKEEDLAAKRFEKSWCILQCY